MIEQYIRAPLTAGNSTVNWSVSVSYSLTYQHHGGRGARTQSHFPVALGRMIQHGAAYFFLKKKNDDVITLELRVQTALASAVVFFGLRLNVAIRLE